MFGQMCARWGVLGREDLLLHQRIWKVKFVGRAWTTAEEATPSPSQRCATSCRTGLLAAAHSDAQRSRRHGRQPRLLCHQPSGLSHVHLNMFRFLGALMGIAIRTGSPINLSLAPPVWKQLVGLPLSLGDLSEIDSDYVQSLLFIRDSRSPLPAWSSQRPARRGKGCGCIAPGRTSLPRTARSTSSSAHSSGLHEFDRQVQAVREGMARWCQCLCCRCLPGPSWETMVCGSREISVSLLKSVTTYKGIDPTAPLCRWFWEVMEAFNQLERSLFLRFVWGRTRLPRTAADFKGRDFVLQVCACVRCVCVRACVRVACRVCKILQVQGLLHALCLASVSVITDLFASLSIDSGQVSPG